MTWLLDLIFQRELRRRWERMDARWRASRRTAYQAEQWIVFKNNARMSRDEFKRRCGYRFPLPAHMRRQEG